MKMNPGNCWVYGHGHSSCPCILQQFFLAGTTLLFLILHVTSGVGAQGGNGNPVQQTNINLQKILCRFRGKEFSPGDVWYPSSTIVTGYCVSCTCLNSGRQNCTKLECPSSCNNNNNNNNNNEEHPCCKYCGDKSGDSENTSMNNRGIGSDVQDSSAQSQSGSGRGGQKTQQSQKSPFGHLGINTNNESGEDMDDDEDETPVVTENSEFISCLHQGKIYKDGDSFTANMSGLPIVSIDQCMQCKCQTGMVVCHMDACSDFKCGPSGGSGSIQGSSSVGDTCCQRCAARKDNRVRKPEESTRQIVVRKPNPSHAVSTSSNHVNVVNNGVNNGRRTSGFVDNAMFDSESAVAFRDVNSIRAVGNMARDNNGVRTQAMDDCISAGRFYMHGSVWHPIIGPFGTMECVVCKCNHGQIECSRLKCPPRRELPCSKPVKVEGHCCPICNTPAAAATNDRQQVSANVVETGQALCVPTKQDVTAFKSQGVGTNGSEYIEFAFVRQKRTNPDTQVEQHLWTLREGDIDEFTTQYLSIVQFDNLRNRQTFVLLGATTEKNIEKFTRREKKLEKRCFSRCSIRITSLERSLRLHRLISRTNCLANERQVVTA